MNKIFKLLAVLMFFSALWAGNMTVHAETGVAQIVGGDTYASLGAAVEAAGTPESAVEIDLLADTALSSAVTINKNVTLDLNGHTLNLGSYDLTLSTSGKVIDSVGGGLLTTSDGKFNSTTQMAVYNTKEQGYVVADVKHQEKILSEASTGTFTLVFKPDFGTAANSLLGSNGTNAIDSIQILLSFDGGEDQTFFYDSDMIKDVYANDGKAFYITVTNFANVSNVKVTPKIVPSLGTDCRGTAYTLTAATVAVESVTLDNSALEIGVGDTATLTATVTPANATNKTVTWTSSATDVATVDANGVVTGVKAGTATITATTDNGKTATCDVTVMSEYDAMIAAFGEPSMSEDFNSYETTDAVPSAYDADANRYFMVASDSTATGKVSFGSNDTNDTYVLLSESATGRRLEISNAVLKDAKYVVFEYEVGYNNAGMRFRLYGRGTNSSNTFQFGAVNNGAFYRYFADSTNIKVMDLKTKQMYKITYVLNLNKNVYDLYIDEKKIIGNEKYNTTFDGFSGSGAILRLYAQDLRSDKPKNADIMVDNIKVYRSNTALDAQ